MHGPAAALTNRSLFLLHYVVPALLPGVPIRYPYFFLDPTEHGYAWVAGQFVLLGVVFAALGAVVVGLDRMAALVRPGEREPKTSSAGSPYSSI